MTNEEIANNYLEWFGKRYSLLKNKYRRFCSEKQYDWDEDIFSDTYLKIYEKIKKDGLRDTTDKGFDDYTFRSFKQNIQREKMYSRVAKRDFNVQDVNGIYEEFLNENDIPTTAKIKSDLFKDFATLYIMTIVEENFDGEHFYLFKLKHLEQMTYKQIVEKTKIKNARQKILDVNNWLKENLKKENMIKIFYQYYNQIL